VRPPTTTDGTQIPTGVAGPGAASAAAALSVALETALKLFAPFLPFPTEAVCS